MSQFQIGPVKQIALTVKDLARATAFYRDTLGLPLLFEVPGLAFVDLHGIRLMLSPGEVPTKEPHGTVLYYQTADLPAAFAVLQEKGVKVVREPHLDDDTARPLVAPSAEPPVRRRRRAALSDDFTAFRAATEERLRAIEREVGEAKQRINALLLMAVGTVASAVAVRVSEWLR